MNRNAIAKQLSAFGRREHALMKQLARVQAERCALLCEVAQAEETALDREVVPTVIEPKDDKDGKGG